MTPENIDKVVTNILHLYLRFIYQHQKCKFKVSVPQPLGTTESTQLKK